MNIELEEVEMIVVSDDALEVAAGTMHAMQKTGTIWGGGCGGC